MALNAVWLSPRLSETSRACSALPLSLLVKAQAEAAYRGLTTVSSFPG
jgi:hypothetical protein